MLPKFKGVNYLTACKVGAQGAIDEPEQGRPHVVEFLYDGPSQDQATNQKQVDIRKAGSPAGQRDLVRQRPLAIAPTSKRAMKRAFKVLTLTPTPGGRASALSSTRLPTGGGCKASWKHRRQVEGQGIRPGEAGQHRLISSAKTDANQQA
jgi:hypothetical protein